MTKNIECHKKVNIKSKNISVLDLRRKPNTIREKQLITNWVEAPQRKVTHEYDDILMNSLPLLGFASKLEDFLGTARETRD